MTNTTAPLPLIRLPVPPDRLIYSRLPTDFYPWTEVLTDLERRQDPEFSAVMDIQQDSRWARFVWVRGVARGGVGAGGRDVPLEITMQALSQAQVTLTQVDPLVAEIIWSCRATPPQPLTSPWPQAYDELSRERFYGALIAENNCSYWESGRVVSGAIPHSGMACLVVTPVSRLDRTELLRFWQQMIAMAQRANPSFSEVWRQVGMQLSVEHVALDPFAHDITVQAGVLRVAPDVPVQELRPALLAAFRGSLTRLGLRVADLPIGDLNQQAIWVLAGMEAS